MTIEETLTTGQVQQKLGLATPAAARAQLARWGIKRIGMTVNGEATWPGAEIQQRITARPGRGARTDLKNGGQEHHDHV